jgi:LacI family transcriptional regulator
MRHRRRPEDAPRVTILDVAAFAAVSTATVSRVLTEPGMVRAALADRVRDAVAALGYTANATARALASLRSGLVGILVCGLEDPRRAAALTAAQARLQALGLDTLLGVAPGGPEHVLAEAARMAARDVEGVLLLADGVPDGLSNVMGRRRVVICDGEAEGPAAAACGADYPRAGETIGSYLAGLGHHDVGFVGTRPDRLAEQMLDGARGALASAGGHMDPVPIAGAGEGMVRQIAAWLRASPETTALVCANDLLAVAAMQACAARMDTHQISIVGCGDTPLARSVAPRLTSLRIPSSELGRRAAELVVAARSSMAKVDERLPCRLIIRQSTGPAPAG